VALTVTSEGSPRSSFAVRESGSGPTLPTWAAQRVGSYLRYSSRDGNVAAMAAHDPLPTLKGVPRSKNFARCQASGATFCYADDGEDTASRTAARWSFQQASSFSDRQLMNRLTIEHRTSAMYYEQYVAAERGLMSYGARHRGAVSKRFPVKLALLT
jgi:hypothetical protein